MLYASRIFLARYGSVSFLLLLSSANWQIISSTFFNWPCNSPIRGAISWYLASTFLSLSISSFIYICKLKTKPELIEDIIKSRRNNIHRNRSIMYIKLSYGLLITLVLCISLYRVLISPIHHLIVLLLVLVFNL